MELESGLFERPDVFCPLPMDARRWFVGVKTVTISTDQMTIEMIAECLVEENWSNLVHCEMRFRSPFVGEVFSPLIVKRGSRDRIEMGDVVVNEFTILPDLRFKIMMRICNGTVLS